MRVMPRAGSTDKIDGERTLLVNAVNRVDPTVTRSVLPFLWIDMLKIGQGVSRVVELDVKSQISMFQHLNFQPSPPESPNNPSLAFYC